MDIVKSVTQGAKVVWDFAKRNSPRIFAALGGGGVVVTTACAIKGTVDAVHKVEVKKEELGVEKLGFKETAKTVWPCYIWTGVAFVATETSIFMGLSESEKKNAALALMYHIAETAHDENYKASTEVLTKPKQEEVEKECGKQALMNVPLETNIQTTRYGNQLFFDRISGQLFRSSKSRVDYGFDRLNGEIEREGESELSLLYDCWGVVVGVNDSMYGQIMPYLIENATVASDLQPYYTTGSYNDETCWVINYKRLPFDDTPFEWR